MGALRTIVAPLAGRRLVRRGVHLLLGGVIVLPYVLLIVAFVQLFTEPGTPYVPAGVLAAVTFVIGTVPPFLPAMRALEITATRGLLDVDLPDPAADPPWESRLFGAGWYVLHLLSGGVAMAAVLFSAPTAVLLVVRGLGLDDGAGIAGLALLDDVGGVWAVLAGLGLVVATAYLVAGLGALLAWFAPLLLGPSPAELRLAMEAQAQEFAERNRLARDLHDSVGHALTVTTLQAAAARRVLDTDPEFARRALVAVEEAGRAAMEDLDHVLGVLRAGGTAPDDAASPQRTLADLPRLIDDTRTTGMDLEATVDGDLAAVPPALSREAYRIVQEGLTNAARHAAHVPVRLRVAATADGLDIDVSNPLPDGAPLSPRANGGRGLRGMRERVRLLRGDLSAQAADGEWRVRVHLPGREGR
ncbi:sensor histidine kinase [Jiangella alba]|uniref:histidine kinase n=1 Tax=Jiangella alba TaxID=561176 RepID=A0A1H5PMW6_9ACTN|nr:histidine kinase [Jiangella alba]SEF15039.1 Signal transduction histidine kinase [Jiangella alba]